MSDANAKYSVEVELKKVGDGWDDLSAGVGKFASVIDGLGRKMAGIGIAAALGAGVATMGALTYGVTSLNSEAEKAAISIGTIFSVNGLAANVPAGITMAQEQIAKMRIDAQKLPGEFEDLQKIFVTGSIPLFQAGATADQARQLSAKVMAASQVAQIPSDVAAREFAMLMEGRAGAHNMLGMRLMGLGGDKAKQWNQMAPDKRLATMSKELDKYSGAIDAFSNSYEGVSSTFIDNVKNFGRLATSPLFDEIKTTLGDINGWFTANQSEVTHFADHLGLELKGAFNWGKREVEEWAPLVENFAETAEGRLSSLWNKAEPAVNSIAEAMKAALADPNGTIDKLTHLGELFLAVSLGGGLVSSLGSKSGRVGLGLELAGAGIAGAAVGADGGSGLGKATEAGSAVGGGALAGGQLGGLLGAAMGAAASALGLMTAARSDYLSTEANIHDRNVAAAMKFGQQLYDDNESINKHMHTNTAYSEVVESWAQRMEESGNTTEAGLLRVYSSSIAAANALDGLSGRSLGEIETKRIGDDVDHSYALGMIKQLRDRDDAANAAASKPKPTMKGGHGGTTVQKVEIVVTSNQSPSRIARKVVAEIANLSHNRRVSPYVKNFSARNED